MSRIRRVLSFCLFCACSLAAVGLLLVFFGTQHRSWDRFIATEPHGRPWSFCSPLINPTSPADAISCDYWFQARKFGWRVGVLNGAIIIGRNRSSPQATGKLIEFSRYGVLVSHGAVVFDYFHGDNPAHFTATCKLWKPDWLIARDIGSASMSYPINTTIIFSAWVPVPFLAVFPIYWLLTGPLRTYCRRRKGLCRHCSYNLTGNTSGACPECGTAIKVTSESPRAP